MKKIKFSVGVLAFMGLAVLNFTQSEKGLMCNSQAQMSTSSIISWISSTYSSISSYFTDKIFDCGTTDCNYYPTTSDGEGGIFTLPIKYPGEIGCCVSGNKETAITCLLCKPLICIPKASK